MYFAREVLIPLALALLLGFLLAPLAKKLGAWRVGRVPAVLVVMFLFCSFIGGIGWVVTNQLIDVLNMLPNYRLNIEKKLQSFRGPHAGTLAQATSNVQELSKELAMAPPKPAAAVPGKTADGVKMPVPVQLVDPPANAIQSFRILLGPLVGPISKASIVIVFTIFMMLNWDDLRNRLFRLAGHRQLNLMTQALGDASQRVSRYLLMQFLVNVSFGALIALGLYCIGLPNALLWGVLAAVLRFVPYVGTLIAGALPFILALAAFNGWMRPVLTLALFLVIELIVSNVVEPWLYGVHTGLSALAILVAAVFWTVLWGPMGLILSTPLTVCLLVMGRYIPELEFLNILLADEAVLVLEAQLYQRLLAMDQSDAQILIEGFLKQGSLINLYDEVMIPALSMAEHDRHQGALDQSTEAFILQSINEFIVELAVYQPPPPVAVEPALLSPAENGEPIPARWEPPPAPPHSNARVICLPASDVADEITAAMLAQVLEQAGYSSLSFSVADSPLAALQEVSPHPGDIVCICALPPFALLNARTVSKRLRKSFPELNIVVGLWNFTGGGAKDQERLGNAFPDAVVTTLRQATEHIHNLCESAETILSESH